jgi:hypothetical protein
VALLYSGQWAIVGDFNLILDERDKNQGSVNRRLMRQFRKTISDLLLMEATLVGLSFTWSNERKIPTLEKIDRWFSTVDWELAHHDNLLTALSSSISDHTPLLMATACNITVKKRFQFESFWTTLPGFAEEVERLWNACDVKSGETVTTLVNPLVILDRKLRAMATGLRSWSERY